MGEASVGNTLDMSTVRLLLRSMNDAWAVSLEMTSVT